MARKKGNIARKKHTPEAMLQAIKLYRAGVSLRQAALKCNIKFTTLRRYALKYSNVSNENLKYQRLTPNYGVNKIFTHEQEDALKTFLKECALKFDGLSTKEIRRSAYEMAVAYKVEIPVSWQKNKIAGQDWLRAFRSRNAEFSVKKSSDPSRAVAVDGKAMKTFCDAHRIEEDPFQEYKECKQEITIDEEQLEPPGELHKFEEEDAPASVWSYFERESNGRACCAVCRTVVPRHQMRSHLKENHPKLVFEISVASEEEASDTQEDVYTEIVYLEDEQNPKTNKNTEKKKHTRRQSTELVKPKKRHVSSSSDEEPLLKRTKNDKEDEIEQFGKYVTCLLKKVPPEACMELQMEIVNLIMKKQLELKKKEANSSKAGAEKNNGEGSRSNLDGFRNSETFIENEN